MDFLTPLLGESINSSIEQNILSDSSKTALGVSLDKGIPDKKDTSSFRAVRIVNKFSKIYERVI